MRRGGLFLGVGGGEREGEEGIRVAPTLPLRGLAKKRGGAGADALGLDACGCSGRDESTTLIRVRVLCGVTELGWGFIFMAWAVASTASHEITGYDPGELGLALKAVKRKIVSRQRDRRYQAPGSIYYSRRC
jgi:hypothetical protein